jgi:hypothetical protein
MILDSGQELALPLKGKKNKPGREDFLDYFAKERLGLDVSFTARSAGANPRDACSLNKRGMPFFASRWRSDLRQCPFSIPCEIEM